MGEYGDLGAEGVLLQLLTFKKKTRRQNKIPDMTFSATDFIFVATTYIAYRSP